MMQITKAEAIYEPVEWQAKHAQGQAMLDSISRDHQGELRQVFGANYQVIMGALQGLPTFQEQAATLTLALATLSAVTSTSATAGQTAPAEATNQQASSSAQPTTRKRKASNDLSTVIDLSNESP